MVTEDYYIPGFGINNLNMLNETTSADEHAEIPASKLHYVH